MIDCCYHHRHHLNSCEATINLVIVFISTRTMKDLGYYFLELVIYNFYVEFFFLIYLKSEYIWPNSHSSPLIFFLSTPQGPSKRDITINVTIFEIKHDGNNIVIIESMIRISASTFIHFRIYLIIIPRLPYITRLNQFSPKNGN